MGLLGTLFGSGAKSSSSSYNEAAPFLTETYSPVAETGASGFNALASLLGLGEDPGAFDAAYDRFKESAGYRNVLDEAMRGVTASRAGSGLLRSGGTLKALQDRAVDIGDRYFTNYLGQLSGLTNTGLDAGKLIAIANQRSQSTGKDASSGIVGPALTALSLFSDRRVKRDIVLLGRESDGLGVYRYNYVWDEPEELPRVGVMADEVEILRPWALGPDVSGIATVRYDLLEAL